MSQFGESLATDHRQTLEFFFLGLRDVSESGVDRRELLYNASVLAHYSQVSTHSHVGWPAPASLNAVFDHFVADPTFLRDCQMMETAGAQCLLLAGFFEDQARSRHNIGWYAELGASFFGRAAALERSLGKARLLDSMAKRFETWRQRHAQLGRTLLTQRSLLAPTLPPTFPPSRLM